MLTLLMSSVTKATKQIKARCQRKSYQINELKIFLNVALKKQ